ncbi:MAG: hypothetical protein POELPBGB_02181 [Bacteroidia bacterium]|nr:hypothetical protein [Bacteroidia bacterium]
MKFSEEDKLYIQALADTCIQLREGLEYEKLTHFAEDKYIDTGVYSRCERGHNMNFVSLCKLVPKYNISFPEFFAKFEKRFNELKAENDK